MKAPHTPCTILWADDDQDDLDMLHDILTEIEHPCKIIEVHNGRKVLDYLSEKKNTAQLPCGIVLDINMPVLDGRETLRLLKQEHCLRTLPVIMFSTSNSAADVSFCKQYGVSLITKPPTIEKFKEAVVQILNICNHTPVASVS